jgi:hypothetical protein
MSDRFPSFFFCVSVLALSSASFTDAQTQASCTFKLFQPSQVSNGVNDWGTTVGTLNGKAAIRYAGGGISFFLPSGAVSADFFARNNNGVTVGEYADASHNGHSFMLAGPTLTPIVDPKGLPHTTNVLGINKWNSTVGYYNDNTATFHGFKRFSSGGFVDLDFPFVRVPNLGQATTPAAINDSGVVVGSYSDDLSTPEAHGFIYHNGQWAQLDVPNAIQTYLVGISNAGVIVAFSDLGSFLYVNGKFKSINVPNAMSTQVHNIAPGGMITGQADASGFVATCH